MVKCIIKIVTVIEGPTLHFYYWKTHDFKVPPLLVPVIDKTFFTHLKKVLLEALTRQQETSAKMFLGSLLQILDETRQWLARL